MVKYVYLGDNPLYTTDINNRTMEEHVLDPSGAIIASKRFGGDYEGNFYFYKYDVRGSTMQIVGPDINDNIVVVKDYDYDAFGNVTESGASFFNETQFTGAITDSSTGYVYMNARFYNPDSARFLTQDTYTGNAYQPWTQNLYSYGE